MLQVPKFLNNPGKTCSPKRSCQDVNVRDCINRRIPETKLLTGSFDLKKEIGRRDQIKLLTLFWWVFVDSGNF
jgi:hypothetical protein